MKKYVALAWPRSVNGRPKSWKDRTGSVSGNEAAGRTVAEAVFRRMTALVLALSLAVQLLVIPYHQALGALAAPQPDNVQVAAELKALFGDAAAFCVNIDDKGAPGAPSGHCDDECPFCRFAAEAGTLAVPDSPALPVRFETAACRLETRGRSDAPRSPSLYRERARAPPSLL